MTQVVPVDEVPPPSSFAGVVRAATAGEGWAVDSLAAQCLPRLTSFAEARGAIDPGGIADLVLIELLHRLGSLQFDTPAQLWAYLYRITRSRIADERRSLKPVEYVEHLTIERLVAPTGGFDQQVADRHYVNGLLSELTSEQREVLEMRFLDDLSIEETATRTGRTLTAVKGLQRRAIRALSAAALLTVVALVGWLFWWLLNGDPPTGTVPGPADRPVSNSSTTVDGNGADAEEGSASRALSAVGSLASPVVITNLTPAGSDPRSAAASFELATPEPSLSRFECRLDGDGWSPCTSPVVYRQLDDGSHVIEVRALDDNGPVAAPPANLVWKVEVDQPAGTPAGVDMAALRQAGAVLECLGKSGTVDQLEATGFDVMVGTEGDDFIDVSAGTRPDLVIAYNGNDTIRTGPGDDLVCGGGGNDSIDTSGGRDRVTAAGGNDTIATGAGDDQVWAGSGNDTVLGGGANDLLRGESGTDLLQGDDGDDQLSGDNETDVIIGGAGTDACGPPDAGMAADATCEAVAATTTFPAPTTSTTRAPASTTATTAAKATTAAAPTQAKPTTITTRPPTTATTRTA